MSSGEKKRKNSTPAAYRASIWKKGKPSPHRVFPAGPKKKKNYPDRRRANCNEKKIKAREPPVLKGEKGGGATTVFAAQHASTGKEKKKKQKPPVVVAAPAKGKRKKKKGNLHRSRRAPLQKGKREKRLQKKGSDGGRMSLETDREEEKRVRAS